MKKNFLAVIGIVFAILFGMYHVFPSGLASLTESDYQYPMQIISEDMKHQRIFSWQSAKENHKAGVEIRKKGEKESIFFPAEFRKMPSVQGSQQWIYEVKTTSLLPGTEYEYRFKMDRKVSDWQIFRTEAEKEDSFQVLIFGDSQSSDYGVWRETVEAARKKYEGASFFFNMGDLVDNGQDEYQWDQWRKGASELFKKIPVAPVMGNHEAYSLDWKVAKPELYLALFPLPQNGPDLPRGYAYSFDYGEVHFVVLNSQLQELKEWFPDLYERQATWLRKDLAQTSKKWKIVLMHRPLWRYPFNGPMDEAGHTFFPIFEEFQVDVVFNAHVHSYSRTSPIGNEMSGNKGIVFITTGRSGDKPWKGSPQKPMDQVFFNPVEIPNYLVLEVSVDKLIVSAYQQNEELIDRAEFFK